MENMWYKH